MTELKSSLEWSEGAMAALRHIWKEEGPKLISMPKESLSIGQVGECRGRGKCASVGGGIDIFVSHFCVFLYSLAGLH